MKRIIVLICLLYLATMFLIYCGLFRDFSRPQDVAEYYLASIQNREGFLTFPISTDDFFDEDRRGVLFRKLQLDKVTGIDYVVIENDCYSATIRAILAHGENERTCVLFQLIRNDTTYQIDSLEIETSNDQPTLL